jgi:hypothetical protein
MIRLLAPTKQKIFTRRTFGFDIETYDNNKEFLKASIIGDGYKKEFLTKDAIYEELKTNFIFRDSVIFATNLSFDFFGVFFNKPFFTLNIKNGSLLWAETYFYHGDFYPESRVKDNPLKSLTFIDSLNYAYISVEKMGNIISMPKLDKPSFLGEYPKNLEEWKIIDEYNLRDSYITFKFMEFIVNAFEELGATFKNTLASTSMSLFKNKYLKAKYYGMPKELLLEQFEGYYGGRTEAFKRGQFKDYFYFDINSLYPSVMYDNIFPDPNSLRVTHENTLKFIMNCEGISKIDIFCPKMDKPLLPQRSKTKRVIFPTGNLKGWFTHPEIREAIKLGYEVKKVYKTQYFSKTCEPFKDFVSELYALRKKYKINKSNMEIVVKLVLNSLYGKFGQKFNDMERMIHNSTLTHEDMLKLDTFERIGEYFRAKEDTEPAGYCVPIWACYVTAYGRIKIHKHAVEHDAIYIDTDSMIIDHEIKSSDKLGEFKLEMKIKKGIIVRPKFYALIDTNDKEHVKIKGLGKRLNYAEFSNLDVNRRIDYTKFARFKESLRRDFIPNQIIGVHKEFSLEDEKRKWKKPFDMKSFELQNSDPLEI